MNHKDKNIDPDQLAEGSNFFKQLEVPHLKSKDEVWDELFKKLEHKPQKQKLFHYKRSLAIGMAAAILLLAGLFSIIRFYSVSVYNPAGHHLSVNLPDGSIVELNAQSTIQYKPWWWQFSRTVKLSGEAFFKVQKGKEFAVISRKATTTVLGTSFNIFARGNTYNVSCMTGKVSVVSETKQEAILSSGYHAEVEESGAIKVFKNDAQTQSSSWRDGMFTFTSFPLQQVLQEIERQYDISIVLDVESSYYYTGFFSREKSLEEVLELVCKPFGLTFEVKPEGHIMISENH